MLGKRTPIQTVTKRVQKVSPAPSAPAQNLLSKTWNAGDQANKKNALAYLAPSSHHQGKNPSEKMLGSSLLLMFFIALIAPRGFNSSRMKQRASFFILMSFVFHSHAFFSVQRQKRASKRASEREKSAEKFGNCAEAPAILLVHALLNALNLKEISQ